MDRTQIFKLTHIGINAAKNVVCHIPIKRAIDIRQHGLLDTVLNHICSATYRFKAPLTVGCAQTVTPVFKTVMANNGGDIFHVQQVCRAVLLPENKRIHLLQTGDIHHVLV